MNQLKDYKCPFCGLLFKTDSIYVPFHLITVVLPEYMTAKALESGAIEEERVCPGSKELLL